MFFSILLVAENGKERSKKKQLIWLCDCYHWQNFGIIEPGSVYMTLGLWLIQKVFCFQRRKRIFCSRVSRDHWKSFKLDCNEQRKKFILAATENHLRDNEAVGQSQHRHIGEISCLTT